MWLLITSEIRYHKNLLVIVLGINCTALTIFWRMKVLDQADLFFNPAYWGAANQPVDLFNGLFLITLTAVIILSLRIWGQIPASHLDRRYCLLPLGVARIGLLRLVGPLFVWLSLVFLLILFKVVFYRKLPEDATLWAIIALTGVVMLLSAFFLLLRDMLFWVSGTSRILGIPANLLPSILLGIIYSGIALFLPLSDITMGTQYFKLQRMVFIQSAFSSPGALWFNLFALGMAGLNWFVFTHRKNYTA